jgi:Zn-dependent protease/CBS domain-containing protein
MESERTMFGKRITIFKLMGFEVRIDASWLIVVFLVVWTLAKGYFPYQTPELSSGTYWWMAIAGAAGLFASIIIHEFAHSIIARREGIPMQGITLFIFGGVAEMSEEPPTARTEFRMAVAGPILSVAIGGCCYAVYLLGTRWQWSTAILAVLAYLAFINLLLAAFNMLPAFPLDGGRVLRAYLWNRNSNLRTATRKVSQLGAAFGTGFILLGLLSLLTGNPVMGLWWFLIGLFLRGAAQTSYQQLEIRRALSGVPISRFMKKDPVTVPPSLSLQDLVDNYVYEHYHDMYPVVEGPQIIGCVNTRALKGAPRNEWRHTTVGEVAELCTEENTIPPEMDAINVLARMTRTGKNRLLVAEDGRLLGVVTLKDLLSFLALKIDLEGDLEPPLNHSGKT